MKNKTLTKNMPNVKWNLLPPRRGPNSQGVNYGNNKKITTKIHELYCKANEVTNRLHGLILLAILALLILSLQA